MININGKLIDSESTLSNSNRAFLYGDGVFETLKIVNNKILFWEDHYFRLMSSMRILRMQIPNNFTLEYLQEQILNLVNSENIQNSARVRITVYRNDGGFYLPNTKTISFIISAFSLDTKNYIFSKSDYEVDLYKDFLVSNNLLSTLKTNNKILNITASIFANENCLDNCLLLNNDKNVVEATNSNLFMKIGNKLITPPISEGCLNGIMRKNILKIAKKDAAIEVLEQPISTFELQKADELFLTNVIFGIQPITKYRKKEFVSDFSSRLLNELNALI